MENNGTNNGTNNGSNNGANNGTNNGANNGSNNGTSNGTNSGSNNGTNNNGPGRACEVDLFGHSCTDDEFEPNDGYNPGTGSDQYALPWEGNSWCDADGVVEPSRTLRGRFCPGDGGDAFRFYVSNAGPVCITSDIVTMKIVFQLETDCDRADIHVEPYTFGRDPVRNELCEEDDDVRCTWTDDTLEILWLWPAEQSFDPRLHIGAMRDDVQFDYSVTFEIIQ